MKLMLTQKRYHQQQISLIMLQQIIKKLKFWKIYDNYIQKVSFDNTIGSTDLLPFKEDKFEVLVYVF